MCVKLIKMASSIFPRFLRNQTSYAKRIVYSLNKQVLNESSSLETSPLLAHLFESYNRQSQGSFFAQLETKNSSVGGGPCLFYPSFSAGLFINPMSSTGLIEQDFSEDVSGDSPTIRADSVKKKRKRKMNKHKLRKLRRRLRRKT